MAMTYTPFFICGLPRSRTAWLANFLTYDGCFCFHEALMYCQAVVDLRNMFYAVHRRSVGNSDCANALVVDQILDVFPDARLVVVDRPLEESIESMKSANIPGYDLPVMKGVFDQLQKIKKRHPCLVVDYHNLDLEACKKIWEYVNPRISFDRERWEMLTDFDVQIFPDRLIAKAMENVRNATQLFGSKGNEKWLGLDP